MFNQTLTKSSTRIVAFVISTFVLVVAMPTLASADVAVVANKGIGVNSISKKEAKRIWLGKRKSLGGASLKVADLPKGNSSREQFYDAVVKKNNRKLKAYWAKIVFSGKGTPPRTFDSDADVISWVASTSGAVGYINNTNINDSVKVLLVHK